MTTHTQAATQTNHSMLFTDSHCHLDFTEFQNDLAHLVEQCSLLAIKRIIIPSVGPENWQRVLQLVNQPTLRNHLSLFPCLGIHPWYLEALSPDELTNLSELASVNQAQLFAIGECGIDGVIAKQQDNLAKQRYFFEQQLQLSKQLNLPVVVHHRQSHDQVLACLKSAKLTCGGILHAFSGSYQQALQYIELGFKLGIGGTITYARAKKTINAVKKLPLEALVLETDAPAMPLYGFQGEINSPIRITQVFAQLALIRSESAQQIAEQLEQNIDQLIPFLAN